MPIESTIPAPSIIQTCSCCRREFSDSSWAELPLVGVQAADLHLLELRNCPCGSTISLLMGMEDARRFIDQDRAFLFQITRATQLAQEKLDLLAAVLQNAVNTRSGK